MQETSDSTTVADAREKSHDDGKERLEPELGGEERCPTQTTGPSVEYDIPLLSELFTIIAKFLSGESKLGSLSKLNAACRLIREATNVVLWTTVTLDSITANWNPLLKQVLQQDIPSDLRGRQTPAQRESLEAARESLSKRIDEPGFLPMNRFHVKYLFLPAGCDMDDMFVISVFPNIKVDMTTNETILDEERFKTLYRLGLSLNDVDVFVHHPVTLRSFFAHLVPTRIGNRKKSAFNPVCVISVELVGDGHIGDTDSFGLQTAGLSTPIFRPPPLFLHLSNRRLERCWRESVSELNTHDPESTQLHFGSILSLLKAAGQHYDPLKGHRAIINSSDPERMSKPPRLCVSLLPIHLAQLIEEMRIVAHDSPEILQCQLWIALLQDPPDATLMSVIKDFRALYSQHHHLLSGVRSEDKTMVEIRFLGLPRMYTARLTLLNDNPRHAALTGLKVDVIEWETAAFGEVSRYTDVLHLEEMSPQL